MKKFVLSLGFVMALNTNVCAENIKDEQYPHYAERFDEILATCGPKISDEYVPDLVLKQKYAEGAICLEKHIKELAKDVFNEENYQLFCDYLTQSSAIYLNMMLLLSEKSNDTDNLPGTFEQMQTYSQLYNFLSKILETVITYRIQQKI